MTLKIFTNNIFYFLTPEYYEETRKEKVSSINSQNEGPLLKADDPNLVALHAGSRVYVRKDDIVKIFCDKPALYSVRLAEMIYGKNVLMESCMPDERALISQFTPLNSEILDSIISE